MNEKLKCVLCEKDAEATKLPGKSESSVECNTCKNYELDHFFEKAYTSMEKEKRAMISAYIRECFEFGKEPPKLGDPDNLEEIIREYENKTIDEKVENLIWYLRKKSKEFGDSVSFDAERDYPITYSLSPQGFTKIRDLAIEKGLLDWPARGTGLKLTGFGWEEGEKLEKEVEMEMKEKREQFLIKLNELVGGDISEFIETIKVGEEIGIDRSLAFNFVRYFRQKGLIEHRNDADSVISITPEGIDEVDRFKSDTSAPSLEKVEYLGNDIFIVHGHDTEPKVSIARFIEKLGLKAIILHEMPNIGRTIIEKFEDYSNVGYAVVLLTPDDLGTTKDKKDELKSRARQNVIFELGYFIGKLGRKRVCVLHKGNVEIPSDYEGILYLKMDQEGVWTYKLAREMKEGGIKIDLNKLP